jgi:hypothetical protein
LRVHAFAPRARTLRRDEVTIQSSVATAAGGAIACQVRHAGTAPRLRPATVLAALVVSRQSPIRSRSETRDDLGDPFVPWWYRNEFTLDTVPRTAVCGSTGSITAPTSG